VREHPVTYEYTLCRMRCKHEEGAWKLTPRSPTSARNVKWPARIYERSATWLLLGQYKHCATLARVSAPSPTPNEPPSRTTWPATPPGTRPPNITRRTGRGKRQLKTGGRHPKRFHKTAKTFLLPSPDTTADLESTFGTQLMP